MIYWILACLAMPFAIWYIVQVVRTKLAYRRYKKLRKKM